MMKLKRYTSIFLASMALMSCEQFNEIGDTKDVSGINVHLNLGVAQAGVTPGDEMTVSLNNYSEGIHVKETFSGGTCTITDLIPGVYTVSVSGAAYDGEGSEYILNGNLLNTALLDENTNITVEVSGLKVAPLIFSEIYFCGSKPPTGGVYFRDQFYEIYNNSSTVQYLDGVYFAQLAPGNATKTLPLWPAEDGNDYAYGVRVWKFPGNGTDYPLEPGEACVISQFAANHQLPQYNPNSPVNGSISDFEFNMNNANFPDQPAYDMVHVFYDGKAEKGSIPQFLTPVFGGAFVIFQVPEGESWDPVGDPRMSTTDLSKPNSKTLYAKIPIRYVLDAVECIDNESMADAKRIPAVLDGGFTYVGETYCGLGVTRKLATDDDGNVITRDNGAVVFQDTNNSTDDFERRVVPMMHRHSKMAPWNHTLK